MDIEELCELLMSRERIRRMRKDMPDPASDSVMPTANDRPVTFKQTQDGEVVGLPTEADTKPIVAPGADAQAQESELPPKRPSGRLTAEDFTVLTDCSVCHMVELTAPWVWRKSTLLAADGIVHDRSAQMLLERTIICEACYECVVRDGGMHIDGGWWIFEAEDADPQHVQHIGTRGHIKDFTANTEGKVLEHKDAEDDPLKHSEPSESAGISVDNHIDGNLDELSWLPQDASQEWREGVKASLELKQFEWRTVVNASLESFEEDEAKRAAREAKFNDQLESDLISAAGQSLHEGKRDRVEQAAGSAHSATQLAVTRTRIDRTKVNGDELAERRKEGKKEEDKNQALRDLANEEHKVREQRKAENLVEERRKVANRVRSAVMALIATRRARAEDGSRKNKGKSRPWRTRLSVHELEGVTIEKLLVRAREAGVNEVELQLTLQACGPLSW